MLLLPHRPIRDDKSYKILTPNVKNVVGCCDKKICCIFANGKSTTQKIFFKKFKKVSNVFQKTTSYYINA